MKADNWNLWNSQFVIFFDELRTSKKKIPSALSDSFDGEAMILPIPDDAPEDIPRVTISSKDNFRIEISKSRIVLQQDGNESSDYDNCKKRLINKASEICDALDFSISWIGIILTSVNKNTEANANIQNFLGGRANQMFNLEDSQNDLNFEYHEKIKISLNTKVYDGDLNIKLGSSVRHKQTGDQVGNLFTLDINTRSSHLNNELTYSKEILEEFIKHTFKKQKEYVDKFENSHNG